MGRLLKWAVGCLGVLLLAGAGAVVWQVRHGVSARDEPTALEAFVARRLRHLAIPSRAGRTSNPVSRTPEVLEAGRAHWADHCAICHGNDGRGRTEIGQGLYPKAPDMTDARTQGLSDGELFFIIENGVRLTGMPAWGKGTAESSRQTWELVHFVRHLPRVTPEELARMEDMNPKSRHELLEEEAARRFLEGEEPHEAAGHDH